MAGQQPEHAQRREPFAAYGDVAARPAQLDQSRGREAGGEAGKPEQILDRRGPVAAGLRRVQLRPTQTVLSSR
jgi:hypothetical protein